MAQQRVYRSNAIFKNMFTLASGVVLSQLVIVLATPLMTRLYAPSSFGNFGLLYSMAIILNSINSLRYEMALPVSDEDQIPDLLALIGLILIGFCVILALVIGFFGDMLCHKFGMSDIASLLWVVPITCALAGMFEALNLLSLREKRFSDVAVGRVSLGSVQTVSTLLLGCLKLGSIGLLLGDAVGRVVASLYYVMRSNIMVKMQGVSWNGILGSAVRHADFPKFLAWATLLNVVSTQLPLVILPALFGSTSAGHYFIANRMLVLPMSVIGSALNQAFFREAAEISQDEIALKNVAERIFIILVSGYLPIYVMTYVCSPTLMPILLGKNWGLAGNYSRILAPMVLVWATASPLSSLLIVKKRIHESLVFTALELVGMAVSIGIGYWNNSLIMAVILLSLFGMINALASVWRFLNAAHVDWNKVLKSIAFPCLMNLTGGAMVWVAFCSLSWISASMLALLVLCTIVLTSIVYLKRIKLL